MKRIARINCETAKAEKQLDGHDDLVLILKRHSSPTTAALFAKPVQAEDGVVEWYSELGGQPVCFADLNDDEQKRVQNLLVERLQSVVQLADNMEGKTKRFQGHIDLLRQAARYPDTDTIYAMNGQPVVTFWGTADLPKPLILPSPSLPVDEPEAVGDTITPMPRRLWFWLRLLLAALALLAILFWLTFCGRPGAEPVEMMDVPTGEHGTNLREAQKPEVEEPSAPAEEPPLPVSDIDNARHRLESVVNCDELQEALREEIFQTEIEDVKSLIAEKQLFHCKEQQIMNAKNICPEHRPQEIAPEMVIVFDTSGSMDFSLLASPTEVEAAMLALGMVEYIAEPLGLGAIAKQSFQKVFSEPRRITAAKNAATSVVNNAATDANIGLVLLGKCPSALNSGFFGPGRHNELRHRLQNVSPDEGTPLADGVYQAGMMLDGVDRQSVILVISDGAESCDRDPCEVARTLAKTKPRLKINVVDILGTQAGNCLASATGGTVYTATSVADLKVMTAQAAEEILMPENCEANQKGR